MKATIVGIESKQRFGDKFRQIQLKFENGEFIRVPEPALGIIGIALDDVLEVEFSICRPEILREEEF